MNRLSVAGICAPVVLLVSAVIPAVADDFSIDWSSIDGGGQMWSIGGEFELCGTIGQADAGVMSGGDFALVGGFWAVPTQSPSYELGDLNCDGLTNAFDIDPFVLALTSAPSFEAYYALYPGCDGMLADVNCDGAVNAFDIDRFVECLTSGGCPPCP